MKFSLATLFAVALALFATVLPALASPISTLQGFSGAARPRIGITLRPNPAANAPIAENIPPVTQSRRDDLGLDSIMRKRAIDLHCTPSYAGAPIPADCYNRPKWNPLLGVSKVAARAFLAGLMH